MTHSFQLSMALTALLASASIAAKPIINIDAPASHLDNNWLAINYVDFNGGLAGLRAEGSKALDANLNVIASLGLFSDSGFDLVSLSAGASYAIGLDQEEKLDLVPHAELAFGDSDADNEFGLIVGAEARFQALPTLELYADMSYTTLFNNDLSLAAGARLQVKETLQVTAGLQFSDDDQFQLGARFYF